MWSDVPASQINVIRPYRCNEKRDTKKGVSQLLLGRRQFKSSNHIVFLNVSFVCPGMWTCWILATLFFWHAVVMSIEHYSFFCLLWFFWHFTFSARPMENRSYIMRTTIFVFVKKQEQPNSTSWICLSRPPMSLYCSVGRSSTSMALTRESYLQHTSQPHFTHAVWFTVITHTACLVLVRMLA